MNTAKQGSRKPTSRDVARLAGVAQITLSSAMSGNARWPMTLASDTAHRGLATASCGPDTLDRYRLPAGTYEFASRVYVVDPSDGENPR